jgi:hypothetical protein
MAKARAVSTEARLQECGVELTRKRSEHFISPRGATDLSVDPKQLAAAIRSQWDRAEVNLPASPASKHAFEWIVWTADRALDGSLDKAGQVVHLTGDVEDCAHSAAGHRALVPARPTLVFYDEGYSADVTLAAGTKESELGEAFLAQ